MLRDAKKQSPTTIDIAKIKGYLQTAEVYYDEKHKNLLYMIDNGKDMCLKFAIQPNYVVKIKGEKQITNNIVTGGYVSQNHKNEKYIHKIRLK